MAVPLRTCLLFLLVFAGSAARAQESSKEKLAEIRTRMQAFVDKHIISGAVTVVGRRSGVLSLEAVGLRDIDAGQPMEPNTLFRIASMTKPITAIGIMMLSEEGKLNVDDPVEKYLPEFRGQKLVSARDGDKVTLTKPSRPIRIRDLLTHTSGLPGNVAEGLGDIYQRRNYTLGEAVMASSQRPLDFEPGTKWAYCNAGIDTLGRIIEVLSGQPYEVFLKKRVFDPLGMADTAIFPSAEQLARTARTYEVKDGKLVAQTGILGPTVGAKHPIPAGGLYSTGPDLARLYQAMLGKGMLGDVRILSEESVATMTAVQTGDIKTGFVEGMSFGYGFAVVREPTGVTSMLSPGTFGHGGAYGTQGWIDPKQDLFVILLIQRIGLPNADGSELRKELQSLAVSAIK